MARRQISLTRLLTYGFGVVLLAGLSGVLYLGVEGAERNTRELLNKLMESTMSAVDGQVTGHVGPVTEQLLYLQTELEQGRVSVDDEPSLRLLLGGALASTPQVLGLSLFHADQRVSFVSRAEGDLVSGRWRVRHGQRIDYLLRHPPSAITWLPPVWSSRLKRAIVPVLVAIYQERQFKGLLVAPIDLQAISAFFSSLSERVGFKVFALYGEDRVLAYPDLLNQSRVTIGPDNPMPALVDMKNPAMAQFWDAQRQPIKWLAPEGIEGHTLVRDGVKHSYFYQRQVQGADFPVLLGVHIEQQEMPDWVKRLVLISVTGLVLTLLLLLLVGWMSRRIGASVQRISVGFDAIRRDDLDSIEPLPGSRITEFDRVAQAFNRMLADMKQHETVRRLFGQYVPETIARELVQHQGSLQPQQARATVFFCDLEGFTALSERLQPPQIVTILNHYFSDIVEILEAQGGVITQFQGDAVLAIFNVPAAQADHADRALRAAVEIQRLVAAKIYDGQRLRCRIGINTGDVVAGSVGAKDRLNYTVHGDAVNLAARLETLNKKYATQILLSGTTVEQLTEALSRQRLVFIGDVQVRGRQRPVGLYSVDLSADQQATSA